MRALHIRKIYIYIMPYSQRIRIQRASFIDSGTGIVHFFSQPRSFLLFCLVLPRSTRFKWVVVWVRPSFTLSCKYIPNTSTRCGRVKKTRVCLGKARREALSQFLPRCAVHTDMRFWSLTRFLLLCRKSVLCVNFKIRSYAIIRRKYNSAYS